ncbi:MAG: zinc-binding dehydrogenase [Planctomycetaceae bacterium]
MTTTKPETCWRVHRLPDGTVTSGREPPGWDAAAGSSAGDLVIRVEAAGVNYKDALCCAGHPGVMRSSPLVPGIDAAGSVAVGNGSFAAGAAVVVTGHGMGEVRDGGFATLLRMPASAVLARPPGLSAEAAMALGTAGLTTLLACDRLEMLVSGRHAAGAEAWLVTGASGGVGMLAVAALAAAGRRVVACSRKTAVADTLRALGAAEVVEPAAIRDPTPKSLVKGRWAGVVDTVGGPLLAEVLRAVRPGGAVAAIGMAGGADLLTSVHPFILRGVTLAGIDAAGLPTHAERAALWLRLAALWPRIAAMFPVTRLAIAEVGAWADRMRAGETSGRGVVIPG